MNNQQMLIWLREKMDRVEAEIKYLEEILVTTSGPADQIVNDIDVEKARLDEYRTGYDKVMRQIRDEEEAKKSSVQSQ